jgi:hypothetical protein
MKQNDISFVSCALEPVVFIIKGFCRTLDGSLHANRRGRSGKGLKRLNELDRFLDVRVLSFQLGIDYGRLD